MEEKSGSEAFICDVCNVLQTMVTIRCMGSVVYVSSQYALSELRHGIIILPSAKCSKCGLQSKCYLHSS